MSGNTNPNQQSIFTENLKGDFSELSARAQAVVQSAATPYLSYSAYVEKTLAGAFIPQSILVLHNDLGGSVVWSYDGLSDNRYLLTLANAFTANKTMILLGFGGRSLVPGFILALWESVNTVRFGVWDEFGIVSNDPFIASIEIRVYP